MTTTKEILVPDIGNVADVDVIEVLVAKGDNIDVDTPLITLETDKASMEVPSPSAGKVKEIKVKVGDKVSKDSVILMLEDSSTEKKPEAKPEAAPAEPKKETTPKREPDTKKSPKKSTPELRDVLVPDIGNAKDISVIEVLVKEGDTIAKDDSLITLESEKASMEIPAPFAGIVKTLKIQVGGKVSQGDLIAVVETSEQAASKNKLETPVEKPETALPAKTETKAANAAASPSTTTTTLAYAGPAVRRFARELGVDLGKVKGQGPKGRILKEDITVFVKTQLQQPAASGSGLPFPPAPVIDFSQFGEIETKALSKIKKISAINLHRNWVMIPHVTQFDEADITDLEAFRQTNRTQAEKQGFKLTPLAFIMKAVIAALKRFPQFNSSLSSNGEQLILKKYYNVGVAVDSPNGLVVPVIRDVDQKGIFDLARELGAISEKARTKGLTLPEMQGSSFTISSLGGISGTAFTPIINAPDVAILGVSKSAMKPIYQNGDFVPRLMLPLSLSYDHRVIDGAEAARFTQFLAQMLADLRNILL